MGARVFSCFIEDGRSPVPALCFVFASDEGRARALARRQLAETPGGLSVQICEEGRVIGVERADGGSSESRRAS